MTITLSQLQAAEKNGTVANLVKQSITDAAKLSTSVKFVAAKNYKAGSKTMSVFLVVPNQFEFVEHMKKNGGAAVKVASGNAKVTKDEKNHHKIVVESLASGSAISHNDVSTLIKPATGNADGFEGTTPMREQAEKEHLQAEAAQRPKPDAGAVRRESLAQAHADLGISREDFKDVFYPASGQVKVAAAGAVAGAFRAAMEKRLQTDPYNLKAEDVKVIGLENLAAAQTLVDRAKAHANHDELEVVGGLLKNGDLALAVVGPGADAAPVVLRASFETKVIGRLANPKNAVANIQPGDKTIDKAAEAQAKKFGLASAQKSRDDIDVGGIKVGTVVLAAHGTPEEFAGTVIGTHLGQKTPEQIVALLTENADKAKRLSPKFHGTLLLSGCFSAAGEVPPDYDYKVFANQVYRLLLKKDYTDFEVKGMPGPSETDEHGNKTVLVERDYLDRKAAEKEEKEAQKEMDAATKEFDEAVAEENTIKSQRQARVTLLQRMKDDLVKQKAMAKEAADLGLTDTVDLSGLEARIAGVESDIAGQDQALKQAQEKQKQATADKRKWQAKVSELLEKQIELSGKKKPVVKTAGQRKV